MRNAVPFRKSRLPMMIAGILGASLFLTACSDGDDGADGATGPQGPAGEQGPAGDQGPVGEQGPVGDAGPTGPAGPLDPMVEGLTRLATVQSGAEITGIFLTEDGDLFFNAQHPSSSNAAPYDKATVGVVKGMDFNNLPTTFVGTGVPNSDAEKQSIQVALGDYQIVAQEGDDWAGAIGFSGLGSINNGATEIKLSNDPDFNAFVPTSNNEGYLFTNWEDRPGSMSRLRLRKANDGSWSVINNDAMMVDFSSVNGTWVNCFGTLSPWNTPLSSEELYFDDTADWNNPNYSYHGDEVALQNYLNGTYPNPYDYGYIVEITDPAGSAAPAKHYVMGRYSHENSVVMPDKRTVLLSDDGTGTVFFKFVADQAIDSYADASQVAGTLYAAKATQDAGTADPAVAGFDIEWIALGHASNAEVAQWIADYNGIDTSDYVAGQTSYISDAEIAAWAADMQDGTLDTVADARVAFLETRKAAAALGATAEFRKMEGVNINYDRVEAWMNGDAGAPASVYAYMAMSATSKTMSDGEGDIQLNGRAADCGAVYSMELTMSEGLVDLNRMEPSIVGGPYFADRSENECNVNNISNPDNLAVLNDGRVLIGEDTGNHANNMLWVWKPNH